MHIPPLQCKIVVLFKNRVNIFHKRCCTPNLSFILFQPIMQLPVTNSLYKNQNWRPLSVTSSLSLTLALRREYARPLQLRCCQAWHKLAMEVKKLLLFQYINPAVLDLAKAFVAVWFHGGYFGLSRGGLPRIGRGQQTGQSRAGDDDKMPQGLHILLEQKSKKDFLKSLLLLNSQRSKISTISTKPL